MRHEHRGEEELEPERRKEKQGEAKRGRDTEIEAASR